MEKGDGAFPRVFLAFLSKITPRMTKQEILSTYGQSAYAIWLNIVLSRLNDGKSIDDSVALRDSFLRYLSQS